MKRHRLLVAVLPLVVAACSGDSPVAPSPAPGARSALQSAEAPAHYVSGAGRMAQPFGPGAALTFEMTLDARVTADGHASGRSVVRLLDESLFGLPPATMVLDVTCLKVAGQDAWFGGVVVQSTLPDVYPIGYTALGRVQDGGAQDQAWSGPAVFYAPPGTTCADMPVLPLLPLENGDFVVR